MMMMMMMMMMMIDDDDSSSFGELYHQIYQDIYIYYIYLLSAYIIH